MFCALTGYLLAEGVAMGLTNYLVDAMVTMRVVEWVQQFVESLSLRSMVISRNPPYRLAGRDAAVNLFVLLKPQRCHGSAAWRRSNPSMESHDTMDAGLVSPFQRTRNGQHTLPVLPALPQFSSVSP